MEEGKVKSMYRTINNLNNNLQLKKAALMRNLDLLLI